MEGKSLLPIFEGGQREGHEALYWNQAGLWCAVRKGKWKLVSPDYWINYRPWRLDGGETSARPATSDAQTIWELYDMEADRTESNDLAEQHPDLVKEMAEMYVAWERHCEAKG